MKVLVVSGFLGAGKTTFITAMARRSRQKFVVMENELGAVGVDGGLLSSSLGKGVDVLELTEGCICCSMKADFATSVLTIENALEPECLLVEPTGVGMLSRIMDNLSKIAYERIELLRPVTILDSLNCRMHAREFPEIFADQLAAAGVVVFSKAENLPSEERAALESMVRQHAPAAEVTTQPYESQPPGWWDGLWRRALNGRILQSPAEAAAPDLTTASLMQARVASPFVMAAFLENLLRGRFGSIVRAKGTVGTSRGALRFDAAGGQYCLAGAGNPAPEDIRAVFIGRNPDMRALRETLGGREAGGSQ